MNPTIVTAIALGALLGASRTPLYEETPEESIEISEVVESTEDVTEEASDKAIDDKVAELEKEISDVESWVNEKWDTYVSPLLGGVSLAVVVSFLGTLLMTYVRSKSLDGKLKDANDKIAQATEILAKVSSVLLVLNTVKSDVENGNKINDETKAELKSQVSSLEAKIGELSGNIEPMEDIKKILSLLVQIVSAIATNDENSVKSGVSKEVSELASMLPELK